MHPSARKTLMWIAIGLAAGGAMHLYYVQEMLAAFALFAAVFGCILAVILFGVILDLAGKALLGFVEERVKDLPDHAQTTAAASERRLRG